MGFETWARGKDNRIVYRDNCCGKESPCTSFSNAELMQARSHKTLLEFAEALFCHIQLRYCPSPVLVGFQGSLASLLIAVSETSLSPGRHPFCSLPTNPPHTRFFFIIIFTYPKQFICSTCFKSSYCYTL